MTVVIDFMDLLLLSISMLLIAPAVIEVLINSIRNRKGKQLIRCKDCKHQRKEKHPRAGVDHLTYWCDMDAEGLGKDSDFCSMAERREE